MTCLAPQGGKGLSVAPWGSSVIIRPVSGGHFDASGSYPLTPLATTANLEGGLNQLRVEGLISVVLVPDPLCGPPLDMLHNHFDHCQPFKKHLTIDPNADYTPSKHHRERIRRGLRRCRVEHGPLRPWLDAWTALYNGLVEHRSIGGVANFRPDYFSHLATIPSLEAFAAFVGDEIAGMTLWFAHEGVVYNHLTACNTIGYANGAAFALYDSAIQHFRNQGIMNLGGGAGTADSDNNGLFDFKQGFSNGSVTAYVCGAVLDEKRYQALSAGKTTGFFPAYRG